MSFMFTLVERYATLRYAATAELLQLTTGLLMTQLNTK